MMKTIVKLLSHAVLSGCMAFCVFACTTGTKENSSDDTLTAEERLEAEVEATNKQLPQSIFGMVLERLTVEDSMAVYLYQCDDEQVKQIAEHADDVKTNIKNNLENGNKPLLEFLKKVIDTGRGLGYRYQSNSKDGRQVELIFSNEDLQDMLY